MKYKLLLLDIDGTLRPGSCERVPKENAEAVCAVQKAGVKIAIATGRGRIGVGKGLLRSIRPDYWVCAGGAQLVDYKGADLALHRLTTEEMYALVDFLKITTCRCALPTTTRTTPTSAMRSSPAASGRKIWR
ncbi:HAD hydrolase family protein [Gemmiger formicilis]|nr:HAD hydrolase family protein [Gemmiger formicilis]